MWLLATVTAFGFYRPGYRALRHTISELAEDGAPRARWVSFAVFLPVGLVAWAIGFASYAKGDTLAAAFALSLGTGYVTAALFPCDPGAPLRGSLKNTVHMAGASIQYLGATAALLFAPQPLFILAGAGVALLSLSMSLPWFVPVRGLLQRVTEGILWLCVVYLA